MKRLVKIRKKRTLTRKKRITRPNLAVIRLSIAKIAAILLIIGLNWVGLSAVVGTFTYFNDTENSNANNYEAGTLDFYLSSPGDFSPDITPTQSAIRNIAIANSGSLGFQYTVQATNISGTLCSHLNLEANLGGDGVEYPAGPLSGFSYNAGEFAAPEDWQFTATLIGDDPGLQGQICTFDFVFDGVQIGGAGFGDTETIQNTVRVSYWDPPIVLNEFLPNAGNYPEFIEIYNKTASPIDLNRFYIKANDNIIPINTTTTNDYSGGSTTIPANGWLVVTAGGNLISNNSGTITLYNSNDVLVDSYTYGSPDYNINNTPSWTNNLAVYLPFNNDFLDKSGNNNNGTNHGTTFSAGKIGQGLTLGSSKYVEVPDSPSLDITDKITLEAWVYPTAWSSDENSILTKAGDGEYGVWNLHYKTTTKGFRFELNNGSTRVLFESSPSTALNTWYHVVGVYDGSEMKLYVNGVLKGSLATSGSIATNNSPLRIGKQFWWSTIYSYWSDRIDEVKIYNRALSATEVLEHYNDVGSSGAVPVDKSYARIPDGVGVWVDPMPTPGRANVLDASPSFSEILESAASAIIEFVSDGGEATTTPEETPIIEEIATTTPEIIIIPEVATTTEATEATTAPDQTQPIIQQEIPPAIEQNPPVIEPVPTQEEPTPPLAE